MQASHTADIAVIGAGIVGSALGYFLSSSGDVGKKIVLIDRSFAPLKGSTGHAPGFVGQYNESEVLTRLAQDTVHEYRKIPGGFDVVGGLELATSPAGAERLKQRHDSAKRAGLQAELISSKQATKMAPALIKGEYIAALHFAGDGAANAIRITTFFQDEARARGVQLLQADATKVQQANGQVEGVMTTAGFVQAKTVIIATGIWAPELCSFQTPIPIVPVAHPYMYGRYHELSERKAPWVRWPEHHVYARDHGTFYGLGSYDHPPHAQQPTETAIGDWIEDFSATLDTAMKFIPESTNLEVREKFNGIFSMTPDNMPLVGAVAEVAGLYMAAAVWVTHAAGSAKFLTRLLKGEAVDDTLKEALDPNRFQGREMKELTQESLNGYNHIYKTVASSE
ncbi:NAD(P)/FAD-dependent oxidoreductase [Aspergillus brunneoviolaceus CBS 621.78]|uniref:N,N-dimethylglycine oxidase n=1 Tax=Aspergillus brunneoviolaceus CBS 621.78 TaxID=1450534 RepID=A0ACD1GKV8_9EURO|nr:N,N-dimethylglycine oxidase [Aspergillus brunneoviolaceus CBS 621.78]RAH49903.1 N,N-dimethylglycine oxidase [Aspergillus brunneoviolaceus CBS 621.78]